VKILCLKLYCLLTSKQKQLYVTPYFTNVTDWKYVSNAVSYKLAIQYRQLLDKDFKQNVIFYVHVTMHCDRFPYNKTNWMH